ncbi:MAG: molybdate ABC transporter substrate-binding protein [Chloroflexi bacterium]|nr:molybdate ABC transporter substrate-binding protein [Chloroflexota bacterium]
MRAGLAVGAVGVGPFLTLAVALVACTSPTAAGPSGTAVEPTELTVFAAASLRQAFERLAQRYMSVAPGVRLTLAFDASSAHRARIEQGARADLFASADLANPQGLADAGLGAGPPRAFAGNLLAIVTPPDDPGRVATPADLARQGVRIVAAGDTVPITKYATEAVANLARLPGYPADYARRVAANIVTREDDVAAIAAKVELGEGDAAIVYVTDAKRVESLRLVPIPAEANVTATYAAIRLADAPNPAAADAFLDWLGGVEAQAELRSYGFSAAP